MHGPVHGRRDRDPTSKSVPLRYSPRHTDVHIRVEWAAPGSDVIVYDKADFTVGGGDAFHCGPKDDPRFHGRVWYHGIVPDDASSTSNQSATETRCSPSRW